MMLHIKAVLSWLMHAVKSHECVTELFVKKRHIVSQMVTSYSVQSLHISCACNIVIG